MLKSSRLAILVVAAMLSACGSADALSLASPSDSTSVAPATPEAPAAGTSAVRTRPFWGGVYLGDAASTPQNIGSSINSFASLAGKRPALVKTFHRLDADLTAGGWAGQLLRAVANSGATNYVALDLNWGGRASGSLLDAVARGDGDSHIDQAARAIAQIGATVLVEPAWEMNGNWNYAWQGVANGAAAGPAKYVAAWRHLVDRFRADGVTNVRWVWNPNTGNSIAAPGAGSSSWNWYANYYPGDAYVDYIGAHGYNGPTAFHTPYHTFDDLFNGTDADHMLRDMEQRYPSKPIILGEMAAEETTGHDKGAWIRDAYTKMLGDSHIVGAVWFDMKKEADWRVDSSPSALAGFRAAMTNPSISEHVDAATVVASANIARR